MIRGFAVYMMSCFLLMGVACAELLGPLLGEVTHDTAKLWVGVSNKAEVEVQIAPESPRVNTSIKTSEIGSRSRYIIISGLEANKVYKYHFIVDGERSDDWAGELKTAPLAGTPSKFSVAAISCLKTPAESEAWNMLMQENVDHLFFLGDNIYTAPKKLDSQEKMLSITMKWRRLKGFTDLTKSTSSIAVWDDHDFGPNDSNGELEGKEKSLEVFMDTWPNLNYGLEGTPGVFFKSGHGDVDFFMLDGRYNRTPIGKSKEGRLLGDAQFNWLIKELRESKAPFKLIAGGSPLDSPKAKDGWESWPWARKRLFEAIAEHNIQGVVHLGGDLHFSEVQILPSEETGVPYPIYNIVSSGFAAKSRPGWNVKRQKNPYVILNFDTTLEDPTLRIEVKDSAKKIYQDIVIHSSDLK